MAPSILLKIPLGIFNIVAIFSLAHHTMASITRGNSPTKFNVLDYGAVGDGVKDDSKAFLKAWAATCGTATGFPTMIIPNGTTFLVNPITFMGPCKSSTLKFQISGTLLAPSTVGAWKGIDPSLWLAFESVNGLTVDGFGLIDGQGAEWWSISCRYHPGNGCVSTAPTSWGGQFGVESCEWEMNKCSVLPMVQAVKFLMCNDVQVRDLTMVDSPQTQLLVENCERVNLSNLKIMAPETSPNTDGIHIQASQSVRIDSTVIGAGDDCISLGGNIYGILINRISCGPGHGISVGSLGRNGAEVSVEEVHVSYADFHNTTNGARIKTWQGGKGFARAISFTHLTFTNVENPIIIDQYYCDVANKCNNQPDAVKISNVTYSYLSGTSKTPTAVSLNCSQAVGCSSLRFDTVNITASGGDTKANCINVQGDTTGFIHPPMSCLKH